MKKYKKTIVTITGIRPDFIRMSEIFRKFDKNFDHILIHTGQHYDKMLSDVFFQELSIRKPDFNLQIGNINSKHYHQTSELSVKIIDLLIEKNIVPDFIVFLGDSNSVCSSVSLKKEGYKIIHIESGMRSGDKRMLEEINRIVCDHCSDYYMVYHENYKSNLLKENIKENNIFVVGNTIVECVRENFNPIHPKKNSHIIVDIHRPENFLYEDRLKKITEYSKFVSDYYKVPVYTLGFNRTINKAKEFKINLPNIIPMMSYKKYLQFQYDSLFMISDSGTAQEEPALLNTKVIVPRDFTERPESVKNNCSYMLNLFSTDSIDGSIKWLNVDGKMNIDWLGDGKTSEKITDIIKNL